MVGKLVSKETIEGSTTLNLENLKKGVYFVNISNNETTKTTKLIVE